LTDVVYAVAACHSVHTYEEYDVPESLIERLVVLDPKPERSFIKRIGNRVTVLASLLMPSRTQTASWSFGTASALAFSMLILLLFNFSEDRSLPGIYRQAQVAAAEIYSEGSDLYAQKDEVVAGLQRMSSGIGEIWSTLGGQTTGSQDSTVSESDGTNASGGSNEKVKKQKVKRNKED
jgi:hypothetical protein